MDWLQVDSKKDLWQIRNIIHKDLMDAIAIQDLPNLPYEDWGVAGSHMDHHRRLIKQQAGDVWCELTDHVQNQKNLISSIIEEKVESISTVLWYDIEGWSIGNHIDNPSVKNIMQIYLTDCEGVGTVFYDINERDIEDRDDQQKWHYVGTSPRIRSEFDFVKNTGYIMKNNRLQLHGVPNTVGKNQQRLSLYCWIR